MRLSELKQQVYRAWECLSSFNGALIQPENFKSEVRTFGDLRRSSTWEKAYCSFWARNISDSCLDAYELILIYFNYKPEDWDYELRHQVFDEFLATPDGLELLKLGLEQLFSADFTPQEREKAHGFFSILCEIPYPTGAVGMVCCRKAKGIEPLAFPIIFENKVILIAV